MSSGGPSGAPNPSGTYLLDSSVLIRSLRGDAAISSRINSAPQVYVSSIVLGELYYGAYGSPTRPDAAVADVEAIERTIATLPLDATIARIYAQVKHDLKRRGLTMPDNDLWIAATALQYDVMLAARDAHFNWITDLRVEQW
jgi:tRNA(fMet)-specific endonuclease VapC